MHGQIPRLTPDSLLRHNDLKNNFQAEPDTTGHALRDADFYRSLTGSHFYIGANM
jgi:hypothetical protein